MNYAEKRKMILEDNLKRAIMVVALPIMATNLIQTMYNLTDTYFVSKLGTTEVAAMSLVWPLIFIMNALCIGLTIACSTTIAQNIGAGNHIEGEKVAGQTVIFALLFSIVLAIVGCLIAPPIVRAMGAEDDLYEKAITYVRIIYMGLPTMFLMNSFNSIKQGQGDTKTTMKFGIISSCINVILDPIFIFVFDMGIGGAAIATVIARGVVAFYSIYTLFNAKEGIKLKKKNLKFNKERLLRLFKLGVPASIGQSMSSLGFLVMNFFIMDFGASTMAAFSIGNRIDSLVLMPAMGIGSAMATIIAQNLGADNVNRAREAVKTSVIMNTIFMVTGGIIIYIFAEQFIGVFAGTDHIVMSQGVEYLKLICLTLPLVGYFQIFNGIFQGSGHMMMAMSLMMGRLWGLRIPLIIILQQFESLGEHAIWYAMILSNFLICVIGLIMYMSRRWEKKVIKVKNEQGIKEAAVEE